MYKSKVRLEIEYRSRDVGAFQWDQLNAEWENIARVKTFFIKSSIERGKWKIKRWADLLKQWMIVAIDPDISSY